MSEITFAQQLVYACKWTPQRAPNGLHVEVQECAMHHMLSEITVASGTGSNGTLSIVCEKDAGLADYC